MLILALVGSALISYLAFPNILILQGFSVGGWLFAIPLLFVLDGAPLSRRMLFGFVWAFLFYACLVHWLIPISVGGYLLFVSILSVQGVIFSCLVGVPGMPGAGKLFYYPCAWVISEALRTLLLGGFSWSVAYSQAFHPSLIQGASWGGTAAVSWVMLFVNTAIFLWMKDGFRKKSYVIAGLVLFLSNWAAGMIVIAQMPTTGQTLCVNAIQPNISRSDKLREALYYQNVFRHLALSQQSVMAVKPELIVWPETAFPDDVLTDPVWRRRMEQAARDLHAHMLIGSAILQEGKDRNTALLLSPSGEWTGLYHKRQLVPFSEYRPTDPISGKIITALGNRAYHFQPGQGQGIFFMDRTFQGMRYSEVFGVAICSEEGYPALFSDLAARGASFLVVMLNDGWFRHPQALMMHAQMGVFRAVETGRPLVRAANTGWSVAFDAVGRRIATYEVGLEKSGFLSVDLMPLRGKSFYVKFGEFFTIVCGCFVIITIIMAFIRRRKERGHAAESFKI